MRYRIKDYRIEGQSIVLPKQITIEDLRLVVNETQKQVICSSMQKNNVEVQSDNILVPTSVCTLHPTDLLTIEIDDGDNLSSVAKQGENQEATNTAIYTRLEDSLNLLDIQYANQINQLIG